MITDMVSNGDKLAPSSDDQAIIAECISRMALSAAADSENRSLGLDDLAFLKGDQWEEGIKAQRTLSKRPCLTINKLPTFLQQVTNSQRKNVPSINVHPVSGSKKELADIIQGAIRHIEYSSNADVCYDTAVNSAASIGFGYFRLVIDYCDPTSFYQDIRFKRIRNAFTVYMDPAHVEPDGSDQQWCIISSKMSRAEFKIEFPNADPCDFSTIRGLGDGMADWITSDQVRLAEYYRIHRVRATAVMLSNGESGWKDKLIEMPTGVYVVAERESTRCTVQWFKLSALNILERAEIPCKWIPVFPVYGAEIDIDGRVYRSGLIRNAKDPARMYNFWTTSATEEISSRQKVPYIGAAGQFEGFEEEWESASVRAVPFLEYNPRALGGLLAPPPQRQPMADFPAGMMAMGRNANDDIKATTGIFDASLGSRSNETSGVAINARDRQGETSNYHFTDNLHVTMRHAGRCIVDMWPKVMDTQRTLRILGEDKKMSSVEINKPIPPEQQRPDPKTGAIETLLNDMTVGVYDVTIGVGPSYDTLRQEAVDSMLQTVQSWPKLMDVAGDKIVRAMDWPGSEEIADRIEKTLPTELRDKPDGGESGEDTGPPPLPPEVQQRLQEQDRAMQNLMDQLDQAKIGMDKAKLQADTQIRVAEINAESRSDVSELSGMVQLLLKRMEPPPALAAEVAEDLFEDDNRPEAGPASDQAQQGNGIPAGQPTEQEIAQ